MSDLVTKFLSLKKIAVVGVRRKGKAEPANAIYAKLKAARYDVVAINPNLSEFNGDLCFPSLAEAPQPMDGVVIATHRKRSRAIVEEALALGIRNIWMHRSVDEGSVSDEAVTLCRDRGVEPIVGGCPMMYVPPVDLGHRCIKWILKVRRRLPA